MKYVEVVYGGDSMTMVVRISEECQSIFKAFVLNFSNSGSNYPIQSLEGNILEVCYRTESKGWMGLAFFAKKFVESRAF